MNDLFLLFVCRVHSATFSFLVDLGNLAERWTSKPPLSTVFAPVNPSDPSEITMQLGGARLSHAILGRAAVAMVEDLEARIVSITAGADFGDLLGQLCKLEDRRNDTVGFSVVDELSNYVHLNTLKNALDASTTRRG